MRFTAFNQLLGLKECMSTKYLTIILILLLVGCVNHQKVGDWIPLTEDNPSEELSKRFGVPNKNHVLDGLTFWEVSPFVKQAPYSFQWVGDSIDIWLPEAENITKHSLKLSECPTLEMQVYILLDSIGESAKIMMADKQRNRDTMFMGSPTMYRIKYYPPDMLGSITLNNMEYFNAPWIAEVKKTKAIISKCIKI